VAGGGGGTQARKRQGKSRGQSDVHTKTYLVKGFVLTHILRTYRLSASNRSALYAYVTASVPGQFLTTNLRLVYVLTYRAFVI
jgi:hypothetical protein